MAFEHYVYNGTKRLRCGYTTGSCAALAAKAAAQMLLGDEEVSREALVTPKGLRVEVDILDVTRREEMVSCAVTKDGGDDIDATDGMLIYAAVTPMAEAGVTIDGGTGIGRVTKPGLNQPVGAAAINAVPRKMIAAEVSQVMADCSYDGGLKVVIYAPEGEAVAARTFNPNLGIVGGISILGTTGIVEPRSVAALKDSIELEIKQHAAQGARNLVITPGNYGKDFLDESLALEAIPQVSCANYIGDALDYVARYKYQRLLFVGHIGKLIKVAGGIMDTHSRMADCRCEIFTAHAALAGVDVATSRELMAAATTDACLDILMSANKLEPVLASLSSAVEDHLSRRIAGVYAFGCVVFSKVHGELFRTAGTNELIEAMEKDYD